MHAVDELHTAPFADVVGANEGTVDGATVGTDVGTGEGLNEVGLPLVGLSVGI